MGDSFEYDVFLSHSSKDKLAVRELAERLKGDGLRVWLDEWQIKPGDSIPLKIEEGLEHSRRLVLVISRNALGSEWAALESHTFRFRDPTNKQRRFIPLRLDDAEIEGTLRQFAYVDWRDQSGEAYGRLLGACRPPAGELAPPAAGPAAELPKTDAPARVLKGHTSNVMAVAVTPDGGRVVSGAHDGKVRVWELASGRCEATFKGHRDIVWAVAVTPDGRRVLSGSDDKTVRV